jgi:hypothetical protein
MVVVLALVAISAHAQLKDTLYTKSVKTFSLQDKYVTPNEEALTAAALRVDVKEVDKILKKAPFLVNDPLTVYPKMKSAQPLMCELINQGKNWKKVPTPTCIVIYCPKKQYPYLIKRLIAQVNRTNGHSGFSNLPCLKNLMEENDSV